MAIDEINDDLTNVEKFFNVAGAIPFVALVSAPIRFTAGKIQFLAGLALMAVGAIAAAASDDPKKWEKSVSFGYSNVKHGILNIIRSVAELCLAISIIGAPISLIVQALSSRGFSPIFPYNPEKKNNLYPEHLEGIPQKLYY